MQFTGTEFLFNIVVTNCSRAKTSVFKKYFLWHSINIYFFGNLAQVLIKTNASK